MNELMNEWPMIQSLKIQMILQDTNEQNKIFQYCIPQDINTLNKRAYKLNNTTRNFGNGKFVIVLQNKTKAHL